MNRVPHILPALFKHLRAKPLDRTSASYIFKPTNRLHARIVSSLGYTNSYVCANERSYAFWQKISDSNRFSTRHVRLETYLHFLIELINGVTLRGKAIALRLAQDGFDICINDIEPNTTGVDEVVKEIQNLGRKAYGHIADVTSTDNVNTMVSQSVENLGPLNVMVANAGIAQVQPVLDLTEDDIRKMFDVNFFGVYNSYAAAARQFLKQGGGGKIIGAAR